LLSKLNNFCAHTFPLNVHTQSLESQMVYHMPQEAGDPTTQQANTFDASFKHSDLSLCFH